MNHRVHIPRAARERVPVVVEPASRSVPAEIVMFTAEAESLYTEITSPVANTDAGMLIAADTATQRPTSPMANVVVVVLRGTCRNPTRYPVPPSDMAMSSINSFLD